MKRAPLAIAIAAVLPLGAGALVGCGSGDTAQGGNGGVGGNGGNAGNGGAGTERQAAGGFTVVSQSELKLATSGYSNGDWEPGGSPATLNGLALTYNQPVTVPMRTKGGKDATFVLTVGSERTKVKVQGSSCQGFTASWYSGYSPERGIAGMRISCAGEGIAIRGTAQF